MANHSVSTCLWLFFFLSVALTGCTQPIGILTDDNISYQLDPTQHWLLSDDLDEVSGLSYVDATTLAMVDDEEDAVFFYSLSQEELVGQIDLGKKDDYEGVERMGENYFVLRSDGRLTQTTGTSDKEYETDLGKKNDTEGLGYDAESQSLLIACKAGGQLKGEPDSENVLVYRFSTHDQTLTPFLYRTESLLHERRNFRTSAIAQHPITQHYYLLSSADLRLAVLDSDSRVMSFVDLSRLVFPQPEGICFAPDGTLYISNEGRGGRATILQFTMNSKQ